MALPNKIEAINSYYSPGEMLPSLQSFRQTHFDIDLDGVAEAGEEERETPSRLNTAVCPANEEALFQFRDQVNSNENEDIHAEASDSPSGNNNQINYDEMYSLNEEIPVMGYTSGDENSLMQIVDSVDRKNNHVHKLMPPPNIASKSDVLSSHLVMNDISCLTEKSSKRALGISRSRPSHFPDCGEQLDRSACRSKPTLVNRHSRIRKSESSDGFAERSNAGRGNLCFGKSESESSYSDSDTENTDRPADAVKARLNKWCSLSSDSGICGKFVVDLDEPIHMTLEEVRSSLHSLNGCSEARLSSRNAASNSDVAYRRRNKNLKLRGKRRQFGLCLKSRQTEEDYESRNSSDPGQSEGSEPSRFLPRSLKHTLCHWFGITKSSANGERHSARGQSPVGTQFGEGNPCLAIINRALPPVPQMRNGSQEEEEEGVHCELIVNRNEERDEYSGNEVDERLASLNVSSDEAISDFASSIQRVKDCGWYWGPISGEMAEKILLNEPDGSFVLRDSSDEYYIFSLTFKLNGFVRHVRIEHEQGNFSFGTFTKFKSHTIVEFIENAVRHSRSGRYLFFIHRRPVLGPMRVQLLHPVSRFKQVQSLQHMCRFAILKVVRRDLIDDLPIPKRLKDYLNMSQYYAEQMQEWQSNNAVGPALQASIQNQENRDFGV